MCNLILRYEPGLFFFSNILSFFKPGLGLGIPNQTSLWKMHMLHVSIFFKYFGFSISLALGIPNQTRLYLMYTNILIFPQTSMVNSKYLKSFHKNYQVSSFILHFILERYFSIFLLCLIWTLFVSIFNLR